MTEVELRAAAFWHSRVCLACEAIVDDEDAEECPNCSSDELLAADTVLRCNQLVREEE
jgi:rRNA maturation endonuclease Nob1